MGYVHDLLQLIVSCGYLQGSEKACGSEICRIGKLG